MTSHNRDALIPARTVDLPALTAAWSQVERVSRMAAAPITDDATLAEATELLEQVLADIGDAEQHPLDGLARTLLERITRYEELHHPIPDADGAAMLAFLMDQQGLSQRALSAATGINQSTLSQVLSRKRQLTPDQMRVLGAHFGIKPGLFL